jgi:hypothetical protein
MILSGVGITYILVIGTSKRNRLTSTLPIGEARYIIILVGPMYTL